MRIFLIAISICFFISVPAWSYYVEGGKVHSESGQEINLYGVSWFGFETNNHVVHGLWARNWKDMIEQIKGLGFTAIRLPFCPDTLSNTGVSSINYSLNPDLQGLNSLEIMDKVILELDRQGFYILLDHHTSDCQTIEELWYTGNYSELQWINDLVFVSDRYKNVERFFGVDIKNEPHGPATWGTGNSLTDWNSAAERAASEVLQSNPELVIFVQGIQSNPTCSSTIPHWWGGNLEPFDCFPLNIPGEKLVLSPHVYGPDVFVQPYFNDSNFPNNMPDIWETHFGYLVDRGYAVIIGEFGGRYGNGGDPRDRTWQDALISYMDSKGMSDFFYWSWNPNSGDTGGILQDNWHDVWEDKIALLAQLMDGSTNPPPTPACSDTIDNDSDGLIDFPDDPGCDNADDNDEFNEPLGGEGVSADVNINNDWGTGYCADVTVTNNTGAASDWTVTFSIEGTVSDMWNAIYTQNEKEVIAQGVSWNNIVNPGQSLGFGFCAERGTQPTPTPPPPPPTPTPPPTFACSDGVDNDGDGLTDFPSDPGCDSESDDDEFNLPAGGDIRADVTINDDWGAGYCAQVDVTNGTSLPVDWIVSFTIEGSIRNLWNAVYQQSGNTVTAEGVSWNNTVQPGGTVNFGFCANR
ncbi:MAG: cellulase family glycosylhydrolase [Candidatus Dadabacteria bacterium]|nr:cellulase family glycosylhydrolase [Candidatus Dadabacteria bacterium]